MNAGKEEVWAEFLAGVTGALVNNDSDAAKESRAAQKAATAADPEAGNAQKQYIGGLWAKHDTDSDGFHDVTEFTAFAQEVIAAGNAKHGGDRTLPEEWIQKGWATCREVFGNEANPGITIAEFGKMMHAAGNP